MGTTRFCSFAFAGLWLLATLPAFATTITATASGDVPADAIRVPAPGTVTSGDFTYQQAIAPGTVGDGEDDGITWSFNFTADPDYPAFAGPIVQANFALTLIPRNDLVSSDAFSINVSGLSPSVVPDIPPLSLNVAHTLHFDLLDFYTSAQLLGVLSSRGGVIPMQYNDDAHVTFARLDLVSVAEPGALALLGVALAGLGFGRRKQAISTSRYQSLA